VVIVSADKDFYQLLSDDVAMYDPNPKRESAMDVAALKEKLGLTPGEFLEAQGLMGDSTDNIPRRSRRGRKNSGQTDRRISQPGKICTNMSKTSNRKNSKRI
jgi:5'-3' exonuclease